MEKGEKFLIKVKGGWIEEDRETGELKTTAKRQEAKRYGNDLAAKCDACYIEDELEAKIEKA